MHKSSAKLADFHRLAVFALIILCFTEFAIAQTFNYSRGWTNGKKRSPISSATSDRDNELESFDMWQLQRLKRLLEFPNCCGRNPPRMALDRSDDDFNRARRNVGFDMLSYLIALPRAKL